MTYSDFDLRSALSAFGLTEERDTDLFPNVEPVEPSEFLRKWLEEFSPVAVGVNTERARSEFIITPIPAEARRQSRGPMNILPGVALDVDRSRGLSGYCDYLITRSGDTIFFAVH